MVRVMVLPHSHCETGIDIKNIWAVGIQKAQVFIALEFVVNIQIVSPSEVCLHSVQNKSLILVAVLHVEWGFGCKPFYCFRLKVLAEVCVAVGLVLLKRVNYFGPGLRPKPSWVVLDRRSSPYFLAKILPLVVILRKSDVIELDVPGVCLAFIAPVFLSIEVKLFDVLKINDRTRLEINWYQFLLDFLEHHRLHLFGRIVIDWLLGSQVKVAI